MGATVLARARLSGHRGLVAVRLHRDRIAAIIPDERPPDRDAGVIDLHGQRLFPSFVDCHVHLREWALQSARVRLQGMADYRAMIHAIQTFAQSHEDPWIVGGGWDRNLIGRLPEARDLSSIARPVALDSRDGHALWCNDEALRLCGIGADTPDPVGGRIVRDASDRPTGVLYENARDPVRDRMPAPRPDDVDRALDAAFARLSLLGIGEIHDCTCRARDSVWSCLLERDASGRLPLRVAVAVPSDALDSYLAAGLRTGWGSERLRVGGCKQLADGALGSQTAAMEEPYEGTDSRGIMAVAPEELRHVAVRAAAGGIASWIHAIGDRCLREALDALESVAREQPGLPHRIEHAQLAPPHLILRARALGVTLSVQPIHLASDMELALRHWGSRARDAYNYASMRRIGVAIGFGSDMPIEEPDPMPALQTAVLRTRRDGEPPGGFHPEERLTVEDAIAAYTLGGADAGPWRSAKGRIAPGQLADLIAIDPDPLVTPAELLPTCRVTLHVVGGEIVHRSLP